MPSDDRTLVYLGLGAAAVAGGVAAAVVALRPKIRNRSRVLLIGDSLAVGMSPHFDALSKQLGNKFSSLARSGSRIDQWASDTNLDSRLATFRPDVVLVSLGTNDEYLGSGAGQRQYASTVALLQKLKAAGAEVYWIGPPKLTKHNGVVEMIQSLVPKSDYFDSRQLEIPRGPDGLHPTARGYAAWAGAVWQWLT